MNSNFAKEKKVKAKTYSTHLRQNFVYSESVNKSPVYLFVLLHLNVFFINQHHYMPKKKYIEQKKQRFHDVTFSMMSFCAKK